MINKNLYLVAIPKQSTIVTISAIRNKSVEFGYGQPDSRVNTLPHITLTYIEEENISSDQIGLIVKKLSELKLHKPPSLVIKEITNWENKIVALFNTEPLNKLIFQSQTLFRNMQLKVNNAYITLYGNTVGDHMKIVRHIYPEKVLLANELVKLDLPKLITLERIAFISYDCTDKDIIWQKKFAPK